jgi:hypothetical protein
MGLKAGWRGIFKVGNNMPCDYRKYDKNWKFFSKQTINDAGNKCELCCAPNGTEVFRPNKHAISIKPWVFLHEIKDTSLIGDLLKKVKIVLTVHHIDGDKENNSKHNLIALCQKCHLRLDLGRHMKNRTRNKALPIFF